MFFILPNNFHFWTIGICGWAFFGKSVIFCQTFEFSKLGAEFNLLRSNSIYLQLMLWVSELMLLYFGCLNLYFGIWTYTLGVELMLWMSELILRAFWYDLWIWKYRRTKHSGMTRESGNNEGPSLLVWDLTFWRPAPLLVLQYLNLEILRDQAFWYETQHSEAPPPC